MPPREPQVRIDAKRDQPPRNRDQAGFAGGRACADRRVADVVQRLPAAWAPALDGKSRVFGEVPLDGLGIADDQRRVKIRARNARMQCQQTLGAFGTAVGRRFDERDPRRRRTRG